MENVGKTLEKINSVQLIDRKKNELSSQMENVRGAYNFLRNSRGTLLEEWSHSWAWYTKHLHVDLY